MFSSATPEAKLHVPQNVYAWSPLHFDTLDSNVVSQIKILKIPRYLLQVLLEWYIWRKVIIILKQV